MEIGKWLLFHISVVLYLWPSKLTLIELFFWKQTKADQQYEVVERITTIEDENGEIMQKTNQVYLGFVPRITLDG